MNYFVQSLRGRAGRLEFGIVLVILAAASYTSTLLPGVRFFLAILIPCLFTWTSARRLHDLGRSGFWSLAFTLSGFVFGLFSGLIPPSLKEIAISAIAILTLLFCLVLVGWPGNRGENRFGPQGRRVDSEKTLDNFD